MNKILLLLVLFFSCFKGIACSCVSIPSVKDNWAEASDVFTATIISIDSSHYSTRGNKVYTINVKIANVFKNNHTKQGDIRTFYVEDGDTCAFSFYGGDIFLFYASRFSGIFLYASSCSRTSLLSAVSTDEINELSQLSSLQAHTDSYNEIYAYLSESQYNYLKTKSSSAESYKKKNTVLIYVCAFLLLVNLIILLLFFKKKKPNTRHNP